MKHVLVIDTSYGATVGLLGGEPMVELDSRMHVETCQAHIAQVMQQAQVSARELDTIVVGVGPAPFTGLRVGIVTAQALAFATGARVVGQDILSPQAYMLLLARRRMYDSAYVRNLPAHLFSAFVQNTHGDSGSSDDAGNTSDMIASDNSLLRRIGEQLDTSLNCHHLILVVNNARRKQLYYALFDEQALAGDTSANTHTNINTHTDTSISTSMDTVINSNNNTALFSDEWRARATLISMNIDYPERIVEQVSEFVKQRSLATGQSYLVDVVGNGVEAYRDILSTINNKHVEHTGENHKAALIDTSVLSIGSYGLHIFAADALARLQRAGDARSVSVEPLYLRRPDVWVSEKTR